MSTKDLDLWVSFFRSSFGGLPADHDLDLDEAVAYAEEFADKALAAYKRRATKEKP